jgi:hypothetical protein
MTSLRTIVASMVLLTAPVLRADEPASTKGPAQADYRRPELVAMTWQGWAKTNVSERKPVAWRPDGTLLDNEEIDWICGDVSAASSWRPSTGLLRPLIVVFRIDERAKVPQNLEGRLLIGGQVCGSGFALRSSTKSYLAPTVLLPNPPQLAAWPEEVDVEIKVPVGEPEIVKSIDGAPQGEIRIADGVRWYVDPNRDDRDRNGKRLTAGPAAVFEIDHKLADPLSRIECEVYLKNGRTLSGIFSRGIDDGVIHTTTNVSAVIEESNPIAKVEFTRLRHRLERYEKLPTHLNLKPPEATHDVPDVRAIRLR